MNNRSDRLHKSNRIAIVALPDLPGQHWRTHGNTYKEAVANGKEALESLIVSYEADGEPLPEPTVTTAA